MRQLSIDKELHAESFPSCASSDYLLALSTLDAEHLSGDATTGVPEGGNGSRVSSNGKERRKSDDIYNEMLVCSNFVSESIKIPFSS